MTRTTVADAKDSAQGTRLAIVGGKLPDPPTTGEVGGVRVGVLGREEGFENAIASRSSCSRP